MKLVPKYEQKKILFAIFLEANRKSFFILIFLLVFAKMLNSKIVVYLLFEK